MNAEAMFRLPPIPLAALKGRTKDYILGRASYLRCSPEEVIIELLDAQSRDERSKPERKAEDVAAAA